MVLRVGSQERLVGIGSDEEGTPDAKWGDDDLLYDLVR